MDPQQRSEQFLQAESAKKYGRVLAKAWEDESFKQRLLSEPKAVLVENGIEVPGNLAIRVVENTEDTLYITLPAPPSAELKDEQLEMVAGGSCLGTGGTFGTATSCLGTAGTFGCADV